MLTVGASLLSDSLLRVTISPAAPLPSRLRGSASQLCSWPPPTTSPRLSHSPTVPPDLATNSCSPPHPCPVLSRTGSSPAPRCPPPRPRSGLQESGCTDPSLSILAMTQVNPAGPAAEDPLPLPQSLLHGPLLPGENARSLKGTPSVCTHRPASSLRPSLRSCPGPAPSGPLSATATPMLTPATSVSALRCVFCLQRNKSCS